MRIRAGWLTAAALSLAITAVAKAQDTEAPPPAEMTPQERFVELHGAVVAYERCSGIHFDEQQAMALNQRIRELVGESYGAGTTLQLIYDAREAMTRRVTTEGCGGDRVVAALTLFETNLADAVAIAGSQ